MFVENGGLHRGLNGLEVVFVDVFFGEDEDVAEEDLAVDDFLFA